MLDIDYVRTIKSGASSVTVTTSATQVVGRSKNRFAAYIQNNHGSIVIRVGSSATVTAGGGVSVPAGGIYEYYGAGALFAIAASSTVPVGVVETMGTSNIFDAPTEGTVSVTSVRTQLLQKDRRRSFAVIQNTDGANPIVVGDNKVLMSGGGITLAAGVAMPLLGSMELWAIAGGTNEIQSLAITGTPAGGTYTLTYGGDTVTLAYNADAPTIQTALRSLPAIGAGNVTVSGTNPFPITFVGQLAAKNVAQIVASGAGLTGGTSPAAAVTTSTPGVSNTVVVAIRQERRGL